MKLSIKERVGIFFDTYFLTSPINDYCPLPNGTGSRVNLGNEGPLNMDNLPPTPDLIGKRILFKKIKGKKTYSFKKVG